MELLLLIFLVICENKCNFLIRFIHIQSFYYFNCLQKIPFNINFFVAIHNELILSTRKCYPED